MIRIHNSKSKTTLKAAVFIGLFLLFAAATGFSQQAVNLTAGFNTTTLPDGTVIPMWGYTCGAAVSTSTASCAPLSTTGGGTSNGANTGALGGIYVISGGSGYTSAPTVVITPNQATAPTTTAVATAIVSGGAVVGFNLTTSGAGYTAAPTITLSGGGGSGATAAAGPAWSPIEITIPAATPPGGASLTINLTNNLSFSTGSGANNIPTSIVIIGQLGGGLGSSRTTTASPNHSLVQGCPTWFIANPGNPGVPCEAPVSGASGTPPAQGPRVQSMATEVSAVAASATTTATGTSLTWANLRPGTYLLESGTHPSIQVPMGLIGMLVVTNVPTSTALGTAYPAVTQGNPAAQVPNAAVTYNAEVPLEFSEIDPVQNKEVDQAVRTAGFSETAVWTAMTPVGGGAITALTVTSGGAGYSYPVSVNIASTSTTAGGATASATLAFAVTSVSGGSGYVVGDTLTFIGGGGSGAAATVATIGTGGSVATITLTNGGSGYTSAPTVVDSTTAAATGALATLATSGSVAAVNLSSAGVGYAAATTTVTITSATTPTTAAVVTASVGAGGCGTTHTCYPPAVNYTPFYFLINGLAFSKTNPGASLFPATAGTQTVAGVTTPVTSGISATGTVLVRMVNAGLHMHVPSMVGSQTTGFTGAGVLTTATNPVQGFTLIAEDGNPLPNLAAPRAQTHVFMAAGKTYDVMVNVPAIPTGATTSPAIPIYDRSLDLSANSSIRDAGMLAYIGVNGSLLPVTNGTGVFATAIANADTYNSVVPCLSTATSCIPVVISDPSKGVIANDINVYGVELSTPAPLHGTLTCNALPSNPVPGICANGTFTYTPNPGTATAGVIDTFGYCANGSASLCTTVTLGASGLTQAPTANAITYTSHIASYIKIASPGVLSVDSDPNNLPLTVVTTGTSAPTPPAGATLVMDPKGGFTFSVGTATPGTCPTSAPASSKCFSFNYSAQNSQGTQSSAATVTLVFPPPSNLVVNVLDAQAYNNCKGSSACIAGLAKFPDYKWIIEEDQTFWVDPNCTANSSITTPGCPGVVSGPAGQTTIPSFGVQFHASAMPFVAQGCTGPMSCEAGQTMLDTRPACTTPPVGTTPGVPAGCSTTAGQHIPAVCDVGNGACRPDPNCAALPCTSSGGYTYVNPSEVVLDPSKRYYISVLPGDAANPFPSYLGAPQCPALGAEAVGSNYTTNCGHTMSGAPVPPACNVLGGPNGCTTSSVFTQPVNVLALPTPLPTGKLSVIVFEDDFPLNGEQDGGGGNGTVAPIEGGLGGFNLVLWDTYGGLGDVTGQDTYDEFNQPLSNSLAGTIDPSTGLNACPITENAPVPINTGAGPGAPPTGGVTGMIVTCPKYEADGTTLSPLAGQAVIANLMPEKFSVQAYPGADRIARGEQWLQTNTLDGQHPHDSFIRIGEPSYFQEYGPAGYHVAIGFASPAIINARHDDVCAGLGTPGTVGPCTNMITGQVDVERLSRTPDQRLYPSGSRAGFAWTQCWVSLGDPDGEDFMFTFCDTNGNFTFNNVPGGDWRLTIGDQWNDQIIDGLSTPANVGCTSSAPNGTINSTTCPGGQTLNMGNIGVQQWQSNLYTRTFIDQNKDGIWEPNEIGIPFIYTMIHYRDGHNANSLTTDFNGVANFNETYPLFNWYVVEADSTRYKRTGTHTVYDAGGPSDGSSYCGPSNGARACGNSTAYSFLSNTYEALPLPTDLSVPGAVYCALADCGAEASTYAAGTAIPSLSTATAGASSGRIDPPWVWGEGWAGLTSMSNWIDFGMAPYASCNPALGGTTAANNYCATVTTTPPGATTPVTTYVGENGGIHGYVGYASTRPFDDASQMIQQPWEPNVPRVTVNLYREGFAADGVTPTLTLVDTTQSASWDDWAQGFYPGSTATPGTGQTSAEKPYMSCPGQGQSTGTNADLFFFTLFNQPNYLDEYNYQHNGGTLHTLPYNSQYKCYDAMHIGNQIQPAPYDGKYFFPSSLGINPTTGKPLTTVGCVGNAPGTACPTTSGNGVTVANMPGTNCTVCVANPDSTDPYRVGTPMLPPGKYVVEVIMPPGYEVYKEEDKNLLIGDNFIAPVNQQFAGLGAYIFIMPDQASVASMYDETGSGYNPTNYQDETTAVGLNEELSGVPGFPGFADPIWPCVGEMRVVPDFLSIYPQAKEVAPFAGATRPLCDRKEVTLTNQMSVSTKFFIYTSTHIASKFTGAITDDYTSEFDPFAPQFGEKFSPPNLPVSTRDYLGNEISRVYSDHWGIYDGLTYSSWEVNPPNITGYSPTIMVQCMNDPGPIPGPNGATMTDPLYNPAYSDFCYEIPFMPGLTAYNDTPVVPTEGFVGAAYNSPDCSYPDATPAVAEVDGDGIGPWVSKTGVTLTITALGNQQVSNAAYSGPSANAAPFNMKTVGRHYGFGGQCTSPTAGSTTCNTLSSVTIGGKPATIDSWSDTQIQVTVPTGVPNCAIQQQAQYGGSTAQCGQLLITAGNGRQSIDSVTVTIGGKTPTHVSANQTIQGAIDAAAPGDLIIVDPTCATVATSTTPAAVTTCSSAALDAATPTQTASVAAHQEMLIMWKPVRLQGVGAPSSQVLANAQPAGTLLDPWRRHVNCLFGLSLQGVPAVGNGTGAAPVAYDPTNTYSCPDTGWKYFTTPTNLNVPQIDRLPLEAVVGWNATVNGNLAEQLQEPSLMGAYEGAGITVLGKGVWTSSGENIWSDTSEGGAFPSDALLLQDVPAGVDDEGGQLGPQYSYCFTPGTSTELVPNPYPSNFECNPSSIDGLSVTDSSQGGGGIFVHGWAHNLQIANNRVYNNAGTLSGGVTVGQGEFPIAITIVTQEGAAVGGPTGQFDADAPPSCQNSSILGTHLPYCLDLHVNVHNNNITGNSSLGDELFSGTLAGGGGASFCTGSDYYKFQYNWVCGNLSSAEGGGVAHIGFIYNGDIEHNTIVLNQSTNPTIPTNGGGIIVMGTPDTDPVCGFQIDQDCPPGLSDGTGPNLVINANLIQANTAESGSGGGIRLQQVNGTDVSTFPTQPQYWNSVAVTNNMIVNNVAGWDGAGISVEDSLNASIINNTIASNDSLASSGVLTQSIGTPQASAPAGNCTQTGPTGANTASCPQSAGVTSMANTPPFITSITGLTLTCPNANPNCQGFSNPLLENNVIWQNRAFIIGISGAGAGNLNQQNIVTLYEANFTGATATAAPVTPAGYACPAGVSYWDVGVRGDTGPTNHGSGFTLSPTYSVLDDPTDYPGLTTSPSGNIGSNPSIISQYCNGSRVPPTCSVADGCGGPSGYGVPPGIVDATAPNPVFTLTPSATVDEGNNWINVSWGPLSTSDDSVTGGLYGNYGGGAPLANYALAAGSPAIDYIPLNSTTFPISTAPSLSLDFFGNPRPDPANPNHFDVGAVEFQGTGVGTIASISPTSGAQGTVVPVTITGTGLAFASAVNVSGTGITVGPLTDTATTVTTTFTIAATATLGARNVTVTTPAGTTNAGAFTVTPPPVPTLTIIAPASEVRGTAQNVVLTGTNFTAGSNVVITPAAAGVSVSGVVVTSPTSISAIITSTLTAAIGNVNVEVTNTGGASNTLPFAITGPVLTAISPVSANRGTSGVSLTLTGSGLTNATSVNFSGNGITVTGFVVNSDTSATATINIAANATASGRNVTVTGVGGTSNAVTFSVTVPPVGLLSISPVTGARGTVQPVTLTGISFITGTTPATGINVTGGGVTVSGFTPVSDTEITANFTIAPAAALTARNVTVTTTGAPTTPVTFTVVNPGTPIINSISPASGLRGTPTAVTLTGTNFTAGSTINVLAPANGLTVTGTAVNTAAGTITATFNTNGTAVIGPRSITVTNPGGTSNAVTYTVAGPLLTSINPTSAARGQGVAIPVVINGTGLTGATAVTVSGGGITIGAITPSTTSPDTQISTTFTIAATAAGTARNVTVTAPGGVSNAVTFLVTIPGTPTLTNISPGTGVRGTAVLPVTITGTNFVNNETTVTVSGGGITVSAVTVTSSTTISANFAIAANASTTAAHNVTVTVAGAAAGSNAIPFTVQGATLTAITPNTGSIGSTVPVTFSGANLTGTTAITGLGAGVTANSIVASASSVTANLVIAPGAALGIRNLGLTTPIGATNAIPFTVQGAVVAISAPAPALTTAPANTTTKTGTITVTNAATANENLTLTAAPAISKVGTAGGTFSITGGTCASGTVVAPGGNCTITVQYAPGTSTATAPANVTITGTGMGTATMTGANFTAN